MNDEPEQPIALAGGLEQVHHLLNVGQSEKAAEIAAGLLAASPSDPVALATLARVRMGQGDMDAAEAAIDEALRSDPESAAAHLLRGVILTRRGRFAEAERAYLSATELEPDSPTGHFCYAELLYLCDREPAALPVVRKSLELDPDDTDAHALLSKVLMSTDPKAWDLSLEAARRALSLDPDDDDAHAVHGAALLHAGRTKEAEDAFRSALELNPSNALGRRGLVQVLLTRAWWYRPLFQLDLWGQRHGRGAVLALILGLWLLVSAASAALSRAPGLEPAATALTALYLGFCAYTWFTEPVTRLILTKQYPWMKGLA